MKNLTTFLSACLVGAGCAFAQDDGIAAAVETRQIQTHDALDTLIGADVQLRPTAEARREAREDGEKAERPSGSVDEVLVDSDTGALKWAIVSHGDKTVAVPYRKLAWDAGDEVFRLALTERELKTLAAFDLEKAREKGIDSCLGAIEASWSTLERSRDGSGNGNGEAVAEATAERKENEEKPDLQSDQRILIGGKTYEFMPTRTLLASEITSYPVYARSDEFGDISKAFVSRSDPHVDFVVLDHGGVAGIGETHYLVPFGAVRICRSTGEERKHVFHVDKTAKHLEQTVKYEAPEKGLLNPDACRKARDQFGIEKRSD